MFGGFCNCPLRSISIKGLMASLHIKICISTLICLIDFYTFPKISHLAIFGAGAENMTNYVFWMHLRGFIEEDHPKFGINNNFFYIV